MRFRVVTPELEEISFEAAHMSVDDGHLKLFANGDYALIACYVPGAWKYCSRLLELPATTAMANPYNQQISAYAAAA